MKDAENCSFQIAGAENMPLEEDSCDFGYSLGVLHHIPDTEAGLESCVRKLKTGAPFLLYLYYSFDNRPRWFRLLWKMSNAIRVVISRLPNSLRYVVSQLLALIVYFPLARASLLLENWGVNINHFPLSQYRKNSLYVMRTDALDRFGTRLEQRFSKKEILAMMERSGLSDISFSTTSFWTAVGYKK